MTISEYYSELFYTWERRGRGVLLADAPAHLEAPFIPFFYHGFHEQWVDDGRRPTMLSRFINLFKKGDTKITQPERLDYEVIKPFGYEHENSLQALQVSFGKDRVVTPEQMKALLLMLSYTYSILSFEIIGTSKEIIVQFVADSSDTKVIQSNIIAFFPEAILKKDNTFLSTIILSNRHTEVIDFGLEQEVYRPIAISKDYSIDTLASIFSILESLHGDMQAGIQILFQGVRNIWSNSLKMSVTNYDGTSFFGDEPLAHKIVQEKIKSPLFAVTMRAFGQASSSKGAHQITEQLTHSIMSGSNSSLNRITPLYTIEYDFERRIEDIGKRQSHRLGMLLNVDELASILHFPSDSIVSKKLFTSTRKTVELPENGYNKLFLLGENSHNGITHKVTLSIEDRLKHTHIIGATGTGKSTLIANLINQDIAHKYGVVLFDPHGDLIDDVIAHIPKHRRDDVVLIDPSDPDYAIGLNILQAHSDIEKEVLSSDLVASFRKHATSWGDQMNSVLGNAILAILEHQHGGSLQDLRRFLLENDFRNKWLSEIDNSYISYYWQKEYPLLKTNSIGSILTRLDTFLRSKNIRDMVSQRKGLDFEELFRTNKIILLKLSQGLIGKENSYLLGSLFLSKIHQAILQRQQSVVRTPVFLYLDEFQNFITPSVKEMLSGIRKYKVGLTISHQDLHQLQYEDGELLNSVLGNISNRIVFRVGEPDAKKLKDGFSHFDFSDFQNLGRGEAIMRIEQPQYDCSLTTFALHFISDKEKNEAIQYVHNHSRNLYGAKRTELAFHTPDLKVSTASIQPKEVIPNQEILKKESLKNQEVEKPIVKEEVVQSSVHRYLQTLVKKMAEQRGYVAVIESVLPDGSGQVDVLLTKDKKTIAVEICHTTDADWEMHNILKCISAEYDTIISLSGDSKQLERIRKKCESEIPKFSSYKIHFFTPDALFIFLDESVAKTEPPPKNIVKGYRVNVSYNSSAEQNTSDRKRKTVAEVVLNSIKKQEK